MKKTTISVISSLLAVMTFSVVSAMPILAASVPPTSSANSGKVAQKVQLKADANISTAQAKADVAITARVTALNALQARINAMVKVSTGQKASLSAAIQSSLQTMNALKAKIDADTDAATLKIDIASITKDNRIYALIIPQGRIEASADREATIVSLMQDLGVKLQARITADQSNSNAAAMQSSYADYQAKIADASTQSSNAISIIAPLQADQGNQTTLKANDAALKQAMADIKTAEADLKAARKDAGTIAVDLKTDTSIKKPLK